MITDESGYTSGFEVAKLKTKQNKTRQLEECIDCGDPVVKQSPLRGRICQCRNAESE